MTTTRSSNRTRARIEGATGEFADVELQAGKRRLLTDSIVTVEEIFGRDPQGTTYFYLGSQYDLSTISTNDTLRVQIVAGANASLYPAIDVTITATATESGAANKELAMANLIVSTLNANGTFTAQWRAQRIKDFTGIFIASKLYNEYGERKISGDFSVTTTGTITVTLGFNTIERRGYATELARSPNDPRQGILSISGTVFAVPGGAGDLYIMNAMNAGSNSMLVNGTLGTPIIFTILPDADDSIFLNELRFYGGGNALKFEQFLGKNSAITNGIKVEIKSDNQIITLPLIKNTEDFKNKFAFGSGSNFRIDIQAGADQFLATFLPDFTIVLKKQGTFGAGSDDYIKVYIQDNLTSVASELEFIARGFKKEE